MKLINFNIDNDNIGLIFKDQYLDIHNNYEYCGFEYDELSKNVKIKWTRSHEEWSDERICALELLFRNVNYFNVRGRDSELPIEEDTCLSFIGFLTLDMREDFDSYIAMNKVKDADDLIINFMSGQAIKINADTVEFCELNEEIITGNK